MTGSNEMMDLLVKILKKKNDITFADAKAKLMHGGFNLYPIVYGRAKALLGLVPTKPRKDRVANPNGVVVAPKRGPGRPRKNPLGDVVASARAAGPSSGESEDLASSLDLLIKERDLLTERIARVKAAIFA